MRNLKRALMAGLLTLLALGTLGTLALADDGGVMQRMMGHDAFTAMVEQMRDVLGAERADQMVASCEAHMAQVNAGGSSGTAGMMSGGMGAMMSGDMGRMMAGR